MLSKRKQRDQGLVAYACSPSTQEVDAGGLGVHGHPWLHSKLEASLGHMRPIPKKQIICKGK